jgi:hypothetical protein
VSQDVQAVSRVAHGCRYLALALLVALV